jgi:DNA-binding NarL/FixJ family response regulator
VSTRVVIVDDHAIVRRGLRSILELEQDIAVVGEAGGAAEALRTVDRTRPEVVLLDLRLSPGDESEGLAVCSRILQRRPETGVVVLSTFLEERLVAEALRRGAQAYVLKDVDLGELVRIIRAVARGEAGFDSRSAAVVRGLAARRSAASAGEERSALTGREREVKVPDVMIPEADFVAYDLGTGEQAENVKISELRKKLQETKPPSRRLPIRDASRAVLYVIHDSTLSAFADKQGKTIDDIGDMTVTNLLADDEYKKIIEANGFISQNSTVAEARRVMASIELCNDVFVTPSGKRDERAVGWLTNTLLAGVQ